MDAIYCSYAVTPPTPYGHYSAFYSTRQNIHISNGVQSVRCVLSPLPYPTQSTGPRSAVVDVPCSRGHDDGITWPHVTASYASPQGVLYVLGPTVLRKHIHQLAIYVAK